MVSTQGGMQRTPAGEGDTSGLLEAPWTLNGPDAWQDIRPHSGGTGAKGLSSFGGKLPGQPGTKLAAGKESQHGGGSLPDLMGDHTPELGILDGRSAA